MWTAESASILEFNTRFCEIPAMDRIDRQILEVLQRDARISNTALAERVGLSESACLRRVRALEQSGVIRAYAAIVDQRKAGLPVNVWVTVTLDTQRQKGLEAFEQAVGRIPEVMECYLMSGQSDYMLRVVVSDLDDFERLHSQHLTRLPNVSRVQSSFAVRTVVRDTVLPIRREAAGG
jgi:Lrp/AsnC family transcriptional regulator, leucine-responsive regulatory protein